MNFNVDKQVFYEHPDLKIGVILVKGINNAKRVSNIEGLLRGITATRQKQFANEDISEDPSVSIWNATYGRFGINPKKFPPSLATLLKRVQKGGEVPHINALVDIYNYFSLKYLLPIGGEDVDWLCEDLNLKYTKGGESFRPLGSIDVEEAKEGEVAYIDSGGITCRYWNHKECERTKFTNKTVNAVLFIEDMTKMHMDEFGKIIKEMGTAIAKYIGGQIEIEIITEENPTLDLGVEGRKQTDDSKVPAQEKAHFYKLHPEKRVPLQKQQVKEEKKKSMIGLMSQVQKIIEDAVLTAYPDSDKDVQVEYPQDHAHGDYASNIALHLTKELKLPPQKIAQEIIDNLPENELIEKAEIAGPGFINIFLSGDLFNKEVEKILKEKDTYGSQPENKKNIVIDFSQPNIAKPLGVHHLLSTIIGQSISNIYKFLGYNVVGINHLGDWGTQFGKLTYAYKTWGDKKEIEKDPINELLKLYVKFHDESEKDPELDDKGREEFKKLEEGDKENTKLWEWFVKVSLEEVQKTYDFLGGIHFDELQGESFYNDKMDEILEKGKKEKVFVEGEEGALIVEFEDDKYPPFLVQKKDGATLYSTRDLAAINYREKTWTPDKILYVVDVAQSLHFQQLFETSKKLDLSKSDLIHVVFGRMQFKDKKMSTRKGNIVLLDDVLKEAVEKAEKIVEEKNRDLKDKEEVVHNIGIGAVKYTILSQNRTTNITFDWDKMLSLEGNSAPYLQYTYARAKSIIRKADEVEAKDTEHTDDKGKIMFLKRALPKFNEFIHLSAEEYKPNLLAQYLFDLAQKFNSFYNAVPVLRAPESEKQALLDLVEATSQILKNGLALLGVDVNEEM